MDQYRSATSAVERKILLEVRGLSVDYRGSRSGLVRRNPDVRVLDELDLAIYEHETLGLVGESGSGKSTLVNCLLRLHPPTDGQLLFEGKDLLVPRPSGLPSISRELQAVFQNPFSSLDPRMVVLELIAEPLRIHLRMSPGERKTRVEALLGEVGLSRELLRSYPHELSGGQAQRVAIARALALEPKLILLDEPTSALDVSVQAQVINLLLTLQRQQGLTYLFVSHDLALVNHISDRIAVMYMGKIVELGPAEEIAQRPLHPYTQALLTSAGIRSSTESDKTLVAKAEGPSFLEPPSGCRFHPRCPFVMQQCITVAPQPTAPSAGHWAKCHLLDSDLA